MSVFALEFSPASGKSYWVVQGDNYDYNQEIARSAYADMLHDTERNKKYEEGLIAAIKSMKSRGKPCNVLDIGTGTGLLSMMAVRHDADTVHACDAFEPALDCARKIIAANGMSDNITLIQKRSTDVMVPEDMPIKANILITEVFDTELIGEGAIGTFRHALQHLLEADCIVVPSAARMYIQPVESSYLSTRNELSFALPDNIEPIKMPADAERFNNGLAAPLFDLQLSELPKELFKTLAPPQNVFRFDFCGRKELPVDNETSTNFTATSSGTCHAFFMWWDIDMDMEGDIQLSCAPYWEHPEPKENMQWRDHWMQAVFYPTKSLHVVKGSNYMIKSSHDEYSLAFNVQPEHSSEDILDESRSDKLHCVYTRSRLAMLNDKPTLTKHTLALSKAVNSESIVLCSSENSFLPFLLARLGAKKVLIVESNFIGARSTTQSIIDHNNLTSVIEIFDSLDDLPHGVLQQVTLVSGEPYFSSSMLPWDDLRFWYVRSELPATVQVCPRAARLVVMAAQFDNLHKIRQPVGMCERLDLNKYDEMIEGAREKADKSLEPQSLWEYPCIALSKDCTVLKFDFTKPIDETDTEVLSNSGSIPILSDGDWNGVAVWMVYELDNEQHVSFGVEGDVIIGEYPKWNMERKQAVYLPRKSLPVRLNKSALDYIARYHVEEGNLELSFSVE